MQYTNLNQIQKKLESVIKIEVPAQKHVERVISKTVSENVQKEVYDAYPNPRVYKRRGVDGGLADPDNVVMTGNSNSGGIASITYENIAEGVDTLAGRSLTDKIVEGGADDWETPDGIWSQPRDFIGSSIEELQDTPDLRNALIRTLENAGFQIK